MFETFRPRIRMSLVLVAAPLALVACGDSTTAAKASGATSMSVALRAEPVSATARLMKSMGLISASVATTAGGSLVVKGTGTDSLIIDSVRVVLDKVRLLKAGVTACPASIAPAGENHNASEAEGCARLDLGAMVVDVPLTAQDVAPLSATIPAGSYHEAEFEIRRVRTGQDASARDSAILRTYPDMAGASIKVTGRYHDSTFVFFSRASAEVEFEFAPPLAISESTPDNLTISLHPSKWFVDATGAILSPRVDTNRRLINEAIKGAFEAFEDHNHEGKGDDGHRSRQGGKGHETESDTTRMRTGG